MLVPDRPDGPPRGPGFRGDGGTQRPTREGEQREGGAMRPQAHEHLESPELEEARRGLSLRAPGWGGWPHRQPDFMRLPSRAGANTFTNDFPLTSLAAKGFRSATRSQRPDLVGGEAETEEIKQLGVWVT